MRILAQTHSPFLSGFAGRSAVPLLAAGLLLSSASPARAQGGKIQCSITDNGSPSRGTIVVEQSGRKAAAGSCSSALSVPAGKYEATVRLDGVLDNPSKTLAVQVLEGKTAPVVVNFETAVLEVRIDARGQRGTGMVTVNRGSKRIGTLVAGVAARLSAGSYEILVRLGGQERRYSVDLRPGQSRVVRAQF